MHLSRIATMSPPPQDPHLGAAPPPQPHPPSTAKSRRSWGRWAAASSSLLLRLAKHHAIDLFPCLVQLKRGEYAPYRSCLVSCEKDGDIWYLMAFYACLFFLWYCAVIFARFVINMSTRSELFASWILFMLISMQSGYCKICGSCLTDSWSVVARN